MGKGDGNFQWYWGWGQEPETFSGTFKSGDEAAQAARAAVAHDFDCEGFTVVEADKTLTRSDVFTAGEVLERFGMRNEECWSEDGFDPVVSDADRRDLEGKLADCLGRWLRKHNLHRGRAFHTVRVNDYFPVTPAPESVS